MVGLTENMTAMLELLTRSLSDDPLIQSRGAAARARVTLNPELTHGHNGASSEPGTCRIGDLQPATIATLRAALADDVALYEGARRERARESTPRPYPHAR